LLVAHAGTARERPRREEIIMHASSRFVAALAILVGCTDSATSIARRTVHVRIANMSTELTAIDLCIDHENVGGDVTYGQLTPYMDVSIPTATEIVVQSAGDACDKSDSLASRKIKIDDLGGGPATIVVLGRPGDADKPVSVALLPDETTSPTDPTRAKARALQTDVEGPTIDVGFPVPSGMHVLVFQALGYAATEQSSSLGPVSARGYVDGIPVPYTQPRLDVWPTGGQTPLGWFDGSEVPFAANRSYTVFAAGRVFTGTAEAFVCDDVASSCTRYAAMR
jgi:hypothetical protein